jgi:hypothetical protein
MVFKQSSSRIGEVKMKTYVKEYKGHKVPEGAACFVEACESYKTHFGKEIDGVEYVFVVNDTNTEWHEISSSLPLAVRGAIELPEAKWEPAVGEECEVESDTRGDWRKSMYVGVDSIGSHVFDVEKSFLWRIDTTKNHVRPVKSAEELERDAFVAAFIQATAPFTSSYDIAVSLFDADFKAPMEKND